jgi:hypothetical protein
MMISPGTYTLAALGITTALSAQAQSAITGLDGIEGATIECRFGYGSGGTTASVTAQISFDGTNWLDVARFDFTTASAVKTANLNAAAVQAIAAYVALASEGKNDGILAGQMRAVINSTGTYVNSTLSLRMAAR